MVLEIDRTKHMLREELEYEFIAPKGLSEEIVRLISTEMREPEWMLEFRLKALEHFMRREIPTWGADLSGINFDEITYFAKPIKGQVKSWEEMPEEMRKIFDKLGIPKAEREFLAGAGAMYETMSVYHKLREDLSKKGVIFEDINTAIREYPDLVRQYFGRVVPYTDNKFAALNSAVFCGGTFIYVPPNVKIEMPLQVFFRLNAPKMGQFERTLIVADRNSKVSYIEGCIAPYYSAQSLHAAVVEVIAKEGAKVRYTTLQNWSHDVYNLVTKRAFAYRDSEVQWIDANIGSRVNMKYPSVYLLGENAKAEILSVAFAGRGQHQDAGAKVLHLAPYTTSRITSKSICKDGGRTTYRGLLLVKKGAVGVKSSVRCDALILDDKSRTDTYPYNEIHEKDAEVTHEATVGKIGDDQLFYLMSRGIKEEDALNMIVLGFLEPFIKELPFEYAVEFNRLIKLEMEGTVG
ncbi:MAG: Fe-S cluster assembly protein SufB [Candidatus Caldarchaeales archaeon]